MHCTSKAGIGTGKCMEFQNQKRFSSFSRRASAKKAWYGYISSQPSQPGGVSIEYGLGNDPTGADVANACPSSPRSCATPKARITRPRRDAQRTLVRLAHRRGELLHHGDSLGGAGHRGNVVAHACGPAPEAPVAEHQPEGAGQRGHRAWARNLHRAAFAVI